MEIPSKYNALNVEEKWYKYWMDNNFFKSTPDEREAYTIVIPPPNVTGVLHMGHMLNNTIQDVLVRRARLLGKNASWVPGTDHASIATEAKVVAKLKAEGIEKADLTREEFLEHAWEWTHKHGGIILDQLKKLGASCDWDRTAFTMDEIRSESVIQTFVDLYNKGLIYRGYRMVNWDPQAKTTLSDEEVIHVDKNAKLYYVKYQVEGSEEFVTIATTRPETILGDTAVCINPNDERYHHLRGKKVIVPIANRSIPIIEDDYVDMEFGTGCLKITPAHDVNDKEIGDRHNLEVIDTLNDDGSLNAFGLQFEGMDRFKARKAVAAAIEELGQIVKIEDYKTSVGTSERTGAVIEPKISVQWFLKMKELSEPALKAVMEDEVKLIPGKFKNTYRHWMENVRDWNISRQLLWGHQIPAFFYGEGVQDFVVAKTAEEALPLAHEKSGNTNLKVEDLKQDADALDTWFSSWLWPLSVFDGIRNPENEEVKYYYPTNDLVTAPEILFFWVARMIIAGYEYGDAKPFENVYLTGIVRDKKGRKMSKSLGNSPDPIELMNKFGADGVRVGMLLTSPAGNDLPFDEELCVQGRNFTSKVWNAFRLVKGWEVDANAEQSGSAQEAISWFENRLSSAVAEINDLMSKYRLSEALMTSYKLIWDDFCSWYLEMVKPAFGKPVHPATLEKTVAYFEELMTVIHPFMPFISEEIWQYLGERKKGETIMYAKWPEVKSIDESVVSQFEHAQKLISEVRNIRNSKQISPKEQLEVFINGNEKAPAFNSTVVKLANLSVYASVSEKPEGALAFQIDAQEYFVPVASNIDPEEEKAKIDKELKRLQGFLVGISKKLSNERFVNNAPEKVIEMERKKQADAEAKIKVLEEQLAAL
ncbi:MAG: valine--tRNA ligase [Schleiferiaceae bacterium]|nr:valine--tRNA ligase [Schleiferiaceae bacterium]